MQAPSADELHHLLMKSDDKTGPDIQSWIPQGESFSVYRIANLFTCTPEHIRNLIEQGEIKVPPEEIARAKSKQISWPMLRVTRESLVEFVRARTSLPRRGKSQRKLDSRPRSKGKTGSQPQRRSTA
jgi:hypothetical protein